MSTKSRPLIMCARCARLREHNSRNLCERCWSFCWRTGILDDYPRSTVSTQSIVDEMQSGPMAGRSYVDIAESLGLRRATALTSYARARRKGLVK